MYHHHKTYLLLALLLSCCIAQAQKVGYLSYNQVLHSMPEYAVVESEQQELLAQYEAEMERVEQEFNRKYEEFLDGRNDFPKTILQKRQNELQELMSRNTAFRKESMEQIKASREEALAPLRVRLSEVLAEVAHIRGLLLIVNTDSNACPYIDPDFSEDVSSYVIEKFSNRQPKD